MTGKYPSRPKMFAVKYTRLLAKCCAAQEIGHDGCWLLTVVVGLEDAKRYSAPVTYYNEQLFPLLGYKGSKPLRKAREKAIEHGWLHYEAGTKSTPGKYWVLVPPQFQEIDDSPFDGATISLTDDDDDDIPGPNGTGKGDIPGPNGPGIVDEPTGFQGQMDPAMARNRTGKGHTYKPIPNPSPSDESRYRFDEQDRRFAEKIREGVKKVAPKTKQPNLESWANDVRKMRELDGLTIEEISKVFHWANSDDFWATNILSVSKLRKQFGTLHAKMTAANGKAVSSSALPPTDYAVEARKRKAEIAAKRRKEANVA